MADLTVSSDVDTMMASANNASIRSNTGSNDASNLNTGTIPAARVGADHIDAITEIASALRSGSDTTLVTGTAGTSGDLSTWDANGDLVDGPTPPSGDIVGTSDTQTLTNKTIVLKQGTSPTPTAEGDIQWSTTANTIKVGDGASTKTFSSDSDINIAASQVTTGTLADARISESSVTQHQAALSITESQISDLGSYVTPSSTNTFTNKTFDANGTGNSITNIETADIASGSKSGSDATLVTGTAGTSGNLSQWDANGDVIDSSVAASDVLKKDGTTAMTGDLDLDGNNLDDSGVLFQREQASADADIAGQGQWWTKTATPNRPMFTDDAGGDFELLRETLVISISDETTALTTGTAKTTFRMPYAFYLTDLKASVTTAPTGSTLTIDVNEGGTTILSTKLTIDATEKTSTTAATAVVISDPDLADDAEITIDLDAIGSTVAGAGAKVYFIGYRK